MRSGAGFRGGAWDLRWAGCRRGLPGSGVPHLSRASARFSHGSGLLSLALQGLEDEVSGGQERKGSAAPFEEK